MDDESEPIKLVKHVSGSGVPSLSQQVYEYLVDRIIRGEIEYGRRLNIKSIAGQLQVSPMPIRDAIKRLEAENIVTVKPRSNCFLRLPTLDQMLKAVESRTMVELFALGKIVATITREELSGFENILARMRATVALADEGLTPSLVREYIELDRLFHTEICRLSQNDYIDKFYREISLHLNMSFRYGLGVCHGLTTTLSEHEQIYAYLLENSPKAVQVLRTHLEQAARNIAEEHGQNISIQEN